MSDNNGQRRAEAEGMTLPELATAINDFEGMAFWLIHDSADGRIAGDIDAEMVDLRAKVAILAEVFAAKASVDPKNIPAMRERIRVELAAYKAALEARWQIITEVGAVFTIEGVEDLYETVAVYGTSCVIGAETVVLARIRDGGIFTLIFSNDVARLTLTSLAPQYRDSSGFQRASSGGEFPDTLSDSDIRISGIVFRYDGQPGNPRNGLWETHYFFHRPNDEKVGVVIARAHGLPIVAEFTAGDLASISIAPAKFRGYVGQHTHGVTIPAMDITNPW